MGTLEVFMKNLKLFIAQLFSFDETLNFQDHMERHKHEFIIIRSICIVRFMSDKYFNQIGSPEIKT